MCLILPAVTETDAEESDANRSESFPFLFVFCFAKKRIVGYCTNELSAVK